MLDHIRFYVIVILVFTLFLEHTEAEALFRQTLSVGD